LPRSWTTLLFPPCRISFPLALLFSPRFRSAANVRPPRVINCRQHRRQETRGIIQKRRRGGGIRAKRLSVRPRFYVPSALVSCVLRARLMRCPFFIFGKRASRDAILAEHAALSAFVASIVNADAVITPRRAFAVHPHRFGEKRHIEFLIREREICARGACKSRRLDRERPSRAKHLAIVAVILDEMISSGFENRGNAFHDVSHEFPAGIDNPIASEIIFYSAQAARRASFARVTMI